jgi:hypothetical protein
VITADSAGPLFQENNRDFNQSSYLSLGGAMVEKLHVIKRSTAEIENECVREYLDI